MKGPYYVTVPRDTPTTQSIDSNWFPFTAYFEWKNYESLLF
jgi:hypothetical protein